MLAQPNLHFRHRRIPHSEQDHLNDELNLLRSTCGYTSNLSHNCQSDASEPGSVIWRHPSNAFQFQNPYTPVPSFPHNDALTQAYAIRRFLYDTYYRAYQKHHFQCNEACQAHQHQNGRNL